MVQNIHEFEASIVVGLAGSVAITAFFERAINTTHTLPPDTKPVMQDIENIGYDTWFEELIDSNVAMLPNTYHIKGKAKFDEDTVNYFDVTMATT